MTQNRFTVLDSWRGICACMVALFHFSANNHFYNIPVFLNAGLFVDFFFVLSGFVIFINYEEKLKQGFGVGRFMLLRFGRLYPLHFATFLAYIAVDLLQMVVPQLASLASNLPFTGPGATPDYILSNILLIHSFGIGEDLSFNFPSWSISAEFYTYLLFALTLITFKNRIVWGVLGIMLLSALFLSISGGFMATTNFGIVRCLYGFGAGALCAILWKRYNQAISIKETSASFWHGIELIMLIIVITFVSLAKETAFVYLAPFIFLITIYVFAYERGIISYILKKKFFVFLGVLSYSIYMTHAFIAGKLFLLGSKLLEKISDIDLIIFIDNKERLGVEKWHGDIISLVYLIVVVIASYITFRIVEEPFRKLFRNFVYKK